MNSKFNEIRYQERVNSIIARHKRNYTLAKLKKASESLNTIIEYHQKNNIQLWKGDPREFSSELEEIFDNARSIIENTRIFIKRSLKNDPGHKLEAVPGSEV